MKVPNPMTLFDGLISEADKYFDYWPYALGGVLMLIVYAVLMNLNIV